MASIVFASLSTSDINLPLYSKMYALLGINVFANTPIPIKKNFFKCVMQKLLQILTFTKYLTNGQNPKETISRVSVK